MTDEQKKRVEQIREYYDGEKFGTGPTIHFLLSIIDEQSVAIKRLYGEAAEDHEEIEQLKTEVKMLNQQIKIRDKCDAADNEEIARLKNYITNFPSVMLLEDRIAQLEIEKSTLTETYEKEAKANHEEIEKLNKRIEAAWDAKDEETKKLADLERLGKEEFDQLRARIKHLEGQDRGNLNKICLSNLLGTPIKNGERVTTKEAVDHLVNQLKSDPGYRISWQANIAMSFKDEWYRSTQRGEDPNDHVVIHEVANKAADDFLNLLCSLLESEE